MIAAVIVIWMIIAIILSLAFLTGAWILANIAIVFAGIALVCVFALMLLADDKEDSEN